MVFTRVRNYAYTPANQILIWSRLYKYPKVDTTRHYQVRQARQSITLQRQCSFIASSCQRSHLCVVTLEPQGYLKHPLRRPRLDKSVLFPRLAFAGSTLKPQLKYTWGTGWRLQDQPFNRISSTSDFRTWVLDLLTFSTWFILPLDLTLGSESNRYTKRSQAFT